MSSSDFTDQTWDVIDQFNDRIIYINPIFIDISGSINAGYLFSQLLYWAKANNYKEFCKTDKELCQELRLGLDELKRAKKKLKKVGLIDVVRKGAPAKSFYTVNVTQLLELIKNTKTVEV